MCQMHAGACCDTVSTYGRSPGGTLVRVSSLFSHCGIDYAGPVHVRASTGCGIASRKAYIALFICLATKAIHLELVGDYSIFAFLSAFSRFCSRRGLPNTIYSDNGTTFVGADRELTFTYRSALRDPNFLNSTAIDNIRWKFIPPSAAHFGGLWEAGVPSVKHHLRRVVGRHTLTHEEFTTLLCQVEACPNSRPISSLSDSLEDHETLTPGHFLIGSALVTPPEPSVLHLNENRPDGSSCDTQWNDFGKSSKPITSIRFNNDRNGNNLKSKSRSANVVLRNQTLPPCKWELGRVSQCHPGTDGFVRVVTVKTATSEYRRPIVKLCVLPVKSATQS